MPGAVRKEDARSLRAPDRAVKQQRAGVCIQGAEFHVVGDHQDGHAARLEIPEDPCEFLFEETVHPLGSLPGLL